MRVFQVTVIPYAFSSVIKQLQAVMALEAQGQNFVWAFRSRQDWSAQASYIRDFLYTLGHSWILSYYKTYTLLDTLGHSQTLLDTLGYSWILRTLFDTLRLSESECLSRTLSDILFFDSSFRYHHTISVFRRKCPKHVVSPDITDFPSDILLPETPCPSVRS